MAGKTRVTVKTKKLRGKSIGRGGAGTATRTIGLLGDHDNRQTGESADTFWLDGPLKTNTVKQVRFMARLAQ